MYIGVYEVSESNHIVGFKQLQLTSSQIKAVGSGSGTGNGSGDGNVDENGNNNSNNNSNNNNGGNGSGNRNGNGDSNRIETEGDEEDGNGAESGSDSVEFTNFISFLDTENHWASFAIQQAAGKGIVEGYADGT